MTEQHQHKGLTGEIKLVTVAGALVNIGLVILKFVIGVWGRSQALVADAAHSLSDLATDFAVLFGVDLWSKPPDDDHPYGHRKIEALITASIGLALALVGFFIFYSALQDILQREFARPKFVAFWAAIISIVSKEALFRWTLRVGRRARSSAVRANAWHHRTDAFSSIPVAVAIFVAAAFPPWSFLDKVGALIVAVFIFRLSWLIAVPALQEMVDTGASGKVREEICRIVSGTTGVNSFHALRTRRVGPGWYVDLHIQVDGGMTVDRGHAISEEVKQNLLQSGPDVLDVVVHLEPQEQ